MSLPQYFPSPRSRSPGTRTHTGRELASTVPPSSKPGILSSAPAGRRRTSRSSLSPPPRSLPRLKAGRLSPTAGLLRGRGGIYRPFLFSSFLQATYSLKIFCASFFFNPLLVPESSLGVALEGLGFRTGSFLPRGSGPFQ